MTRRRIAALASALALAVSAPAAQEIVVYRCVGSDGQVLLQNTARCPKGMREQRRVLERPTVAASAPAPAPAVPAPAPAPAAVEVPPPDPAPPAAPLAAPPALLACRTREGETYFSDEAEPSRCVPLRAVGLDGRASAAEACERVVDACAPVPETERCDAWAAYRRDAERVAAFRPLDADAARETLARIDAALAGSVCPR